MKSIATLLFCAVLVSTSYAGHDGTAVIKAKSGTGRTHLELHTSDIGEGVKYLKFTIDGKSYEVDVRKDPDTYGYVIHDRRNRVFTVFVDNEQIDFKFWIIPDKLKVKDQTGSSEKWEFYAYVEATDPRVFTDKTRNTPMSPKIYLYGTLDFSL